MKKIAILFSVFALLWSCEKSDPSGSGLKDVSDGEITVNNLPDVIYASLPGDHQTRTVVDGKKVLWQKGDAIFYCAHQTLNARYVFNGEDGSASAELTKDNTVPGNPVSEYADPNDAPKTVAFSLGIYPYSDITTKYVDADNPYYFTYADYQETQIYAPNSFGPGANSMIAVGKNSLDDNLHFKNLCGFLVIKLYGNCLVKSIKLSANNESIMLAGSILLSVYPGGVLEYGSWSPHKFNSVTLDCSNGGEGVEISNDPENPTEFWFALPPVTIEGGFKIDITDGFDNVITKSTDKTVEITRNDIQPMAALSMEQLISERHMFLYTRSDNNKTPLTFDTAPFDAEILSHYYDEFKQQFVIKFKSTPTQINEGAFKGLDLTSVNISGNVETIGKSAFKDCDKMTSFIVTGSVNTIGESAFEDSDALATVSIAGTVEKVGRYAFSDCDAVTELAIKANTVEEYAYEDMDGLKKITLYGSTIGDRVLSDCAVLEEVTLVGAMNSIGSYAFYNCDKLKTISFTGTVGSIGNNAFDNCDGIAALTIPASVGQIGNYSFTNCDGLKELTIKTAKVGEYAFYDCDGLQTLVIDGSVNSIGNYAFDECGALKNLTIKPSETATPLECGCGSAGYSPFTSAPLETVNLNREIIVPSDPALFPNKSSLTSVTLGNQVKKLTSYEFYNTNITSIKIPASVEEIGSNAFRDCDCLKQVEIEESDIPLTIGYQLTSVVDFIKHEWGPFYDSPLEYIYLNRAINYVKGSADEPFTPDSWDEGLFANEHYNVTNLSTTVKLGSKVTTISDYMFSGVRMETIDIPTSVTSIGYRAFYDCRNLMHVKCLGLNPPTLGGSVFESCSKLNSISVPGGDSFDSYKSMWSDYASLIYESQE